MRITIRLSSDEKRKLDCIMRELDYTEKSAALKYSLSSTANGLMTRKKKQL